MEATFPAIRRILLKWYSTHRRDLPWRRTRNPYHILVSEIMLQQTQVDRVIPKYKAFLRAFPTVKKLAEAKTSEVITAWAGLGYNRRALFLQKTAQAVQTQYKGSFPQDLELLKALPGIGDYTARAILSFAFEQPVPMMDTNHRRFYQRTLFGMNAQPDKVLLEAAYQLIPLKKAYDWNQALMDFGSRICKSQRPECDICPLRTYCKAYPDIVSLAAEQKKKKKAAVRFEETDRYIRGRIIAQLREIEHLRFTDIGKMLPNFPEERLEKVIAGLERDGLIKRSKRGMVLPD